MRTALTMLLTLSSFVSGTVLAQDEPEMSSSGDAQLRSQLAELRTACMNRSAVGCLGLGRSYATGRGTSVDLPRAATFLGHACSLGHREGCAELGLMLLDGNGVTRDARRAQRLLTRACEAGAPVACDSVATARARASALPPIRQAVVRAVRTEPRVDLSRSTSRSGGSSNAGVVLAVVLGILAVVGIGVALGVILADSGGFDLGPSSGSSGWRY